MIHSARSALKIFALVVAASAALTGCGQAAKSADTTASTSTITVTHTQGTTELAKAPDRIVVFDFGSLDTLRALGLADKVVGLPKGGVLPNELKEFADAKYANVGTLFEPDYEAINKLKPDLVIVGFRSAKTYPEMSKHFKTIDVTYTYDKSFYDSVAYAAQIVGVATGTSSAVDEKLGTLKTAIAATKAKNPGGSAMVLMTTAGKVTLHGGASRYAAIHRDFGFPAAVPEVQEAPHGDPVSFEAIQKANPAYLFVIDRDAAIGESGAAAKQVLDNELVRSTPAWMNDNVIYLTGSRWYVTMHGLDNARAMVDEVAAALP